MTVVGFAALTFYEKKSIHTVGDIAMLSSGIYQQEECLSQKQLLQCTSLLKLANLSRIGKCKAYVVNHWDG